MNIDERLEKLTANQESFYEELRASKQDFDARMRASDERLRRIEEHDEKNQIALAKIMDSIGRLERIAWAHSMTAEEMDARIAALEGRAKKKLQ